MWKSKSVVRTILICVSLSGVNNALPRGLNSWVRILSKWKIFQAKGGMASVVVLKQMNLSHRLERLVHLELLVKYKQYLQEGFVTGDLDPPESSSSSKPKEELANRAEHEQYLQKGFITGELNPPESPSPSEPEKKACNDCVYNYWIPRPRNRRACADSSLACWYRW
jgi:hypothetical protein